MQNFEYCTPTRLIFGQGVVEKLPEVMNRYGKKDSFDLWRWKH